MSEITYDHPQFVIVEDPAVEWPVLVELPEAGGVFAKFQFAALIRVLSPADYEAIFAGAQKVDAQIGEGKEAKTVQLPTMSQVMRDNVVTFSKLIKGWSGIKDTQGNEVAFSQERLSAQILGPRGPALSVGLHRAISEVRFGTRLDGVDIPGAEIKN